MNCKRAITVLSFTIILGMLLFLLFYTGYIAF